MSELVCYIERAERGMLPVRLRLLSARVDESWQFPEVRADDRAALQRGLAEAAGWLAAEIRAHSRAGLGAVVLDADGARCGWVTAASADPDAIGAMLRQAAEPVADTDAAAVVGSAPHLAVNPDIRIPGAAAFHPLTDASGSVLRVRPGPAGGAPRRRLGVAAIPDATVRLLLDELDRAGVESRRVVPVWQALAEAFAAGGGAGDGRLTSVGTAAQVCLDVGAGRLIWSWTHGGTVIAGGAARVPRGARAEGRPGWALTRADLGKLANEWVAWSTQLGAAPAQVRVVLPEGAWTDPASLGERVAAVWPGATTDLAFDEDPLALALVRFAEGLGDPRLPESSRGSVRSLQARAGRQHRAMYRWAALSIGIAAAGMGIAAFQVYESAGQAAETARGKRAEWRTVAGELYPPAQDAVMSLPAYDARVLDDVQSELETQRRRVAPVVIDPAKPILQELETLSFVLGNGEYSVERIDLSANAATIEMTVPDTAAYEELLASLDGIAGSAIYDWNATPRTTPGGIHVSLYGAWTMPARRPNPGGA